MKHLLALCCLILLACAAQAQRVTEVDCRGRVITPAACGCGRVCDCTPGHGCGCTGAQRQHLTSLFAWRDATNDRLRAIEGQRQQAPQQAPVLDAETLALLQQLLDLNRQILALMQQMQAQQHAPQPPPAMPQIVLISPGEHGPRVDLPGPGKPRVDLPGPGVPKVDLPGPGTPKVDLPGPGAPKVDLPGSGAPKVDPGGSGAPRIDLPGTGKDDGTIKPGTAKPAATGYTRYTQR